ncbi:MAG TPA: S8 family serine peptidase [Humisphaera sp.]|jgi:hypothetical protein|nr:S8 family serine peptidase [Humisphaera sp.]
MRFSRKGRKLREVCRSADAVLERLECRQLLSAAFNITSLTAMRNNAAFSQVNGSGVGIAVLDTGVFAQNPDLSSNVVAFYNAVSDPITTTNLSPTNAIDHEGHGSHVSGIAASSNPSIGVAYKAKLVDIRVFADVGESQLGGDPVLRGLEWVAANYQTYNIKVVNMSLGESGVNDNTVTTADAQDAEAVEIKDLQRLGVTVVSASGNSYANDPTPGASFPAVVSTISVANTWASTGQAADFNVPYGGSGDEFYAIDKSATPDTLASTSQRSTLNNQLAAPGEDIFSTWNGTPDSSNGSDLLHNTISGTSMAAPFVSGVVALMQQAAKFFGGHYISDPSQVLQILQQTADTVVDANNPNNSRFDSLGGTTSNLPETGLGFKRVNVLKAIQEVEQIVTGSTTLTGPTPGPDTDNTTTTATPVNSIDGTVLYTFDGTIGSDGLVLDGANDVDLFKLDLVSPGSFVVALSQPVGGTAFAGALRLFDSAGNVVAQATGTSSSYPVLSTPIGTPLAIGTYYLGISSVGNQSYHINGTGAAGGTSQGDYSVQIELQNPDPNGTAQGAAGIDVTQPNEILTDPNTNAQYTDVVQTGQLGSDPPPAGSTTRVTVTSDVDMFKLTAPDTGLLDVTTDTSSYFFGADTFIKVFDANLNLLGSNDDANFQTTDSALSVHVTAGQTYYVAVTVPVNSGFDPKNPYASRVPNATLLNQPYDLHLRFDNGDTNGTAVSAVPAGVGTISGSIGADNGVPLLGANNGSKDVDFLSFTATSTGLLDVSALSNSSGFTPVVSLWEFTAGQTDIVKVADTSALPNQHLIAQVTANEPFFVAVTGLGNSNFNWFAIASGSGGQTGNYTLATTLRPQSDLAALSDNSIQNGTPEAISVGQTLKGNLGMDGNVVIGSTDVDMYSFVAPTTQVVDIRTSTGQEGDADTVLRVFDGGGNQLAVNDNRDSSTTASDVKILVLAGQTYFFGISGAGANATSYNPLTGNGAGSGSTGNYSLSVNPVAAGLSVSDAATVVAFPGNVAIFTVSLDAPLTSSVTVDYATADDTAVAGTDYTATSGTLTFAPGVTTQTVTVPVLVDSAKQGNQLFSFTLSNAQGAPIDSANANGTIDEEPVTTINFSAGKSASYVDAAGKKVTVSLNGPGSGTLAFVGSSKTPQNLNIDGSTGGSALSIKGSNVIIDGVVITGSLGSFNAKTTQLNGSMTVSGALGKLSLGNVTAAQSGQAISIGTADLPTSLIVGSVTDEGLSTPGLIASLSAKSWANSGSTTASISAGSIANIKVTGNLAINLTTGAVGNVRIGGSITGGNWNVASIQGMKVTGDIFNTKIQVTATAGLVIGTLTVGKLVSGSDIFADGSIGKVTFGAMLGSDLFAGVADLVTALPDAASDFASAQSIASFTIKGTSAISFNNANVAASSIGKASISRAGGANGGTPFGFAASTLGAFSNKGTVTWKNGESPSLLVPEGDLVVRLLT